MNIIYEDENLIAVEKKQGIPVQSDKTGDKDLLTEIKENLKNENIFLLHRLDRPVGGIILFSKNEQFNKYVNKIMSEAKFYKKYLAVVCGEAKESGFLEDYLIKNQRLNISKAVSKNTKGSKIAKLEYRCLKKIHNEKYGILSLVEINLLTGRHHQIRVQLSNAGLPIWGDTKYNKYFLHNKQFVSISLWSNEIKFYYPKINDFLILKSLPSDEFIPK